MSFSAEGVVVISALLACLAGAITKLFMLLLAAKDESMARIISTRESWRHMAEVATTALEEIARLKRIELNQPVVVPLAPVNPEHSSPPTEEQIEAAEIATLRARLTAAILAISWKPLTTEDALE